MLVKFESSLLSEIETRLKVNGTKGRDRKIPVFSPKS
jgi:hypothetical protein